MSADVGVLRDAMTEVIDPCSIAVGRPQNLVEMGLVEDIVWEDGIVVVTLTLTDPACFFFGDISRYVTDVLREVPGVTEVHVEISSEKLWLPPTDPVARTSEAL